MEKRRKLGNTSGSMKALILVPIILVLLVAGIFALVYSLVSSADKNGNMLEGTWKYNNESALVIDLEKQTYSLSLDGNNEKGNIKEINLIKNEYDKGIISYKVTFDGNGEYVADISIDYNGDDKMVMDFHSEKTNESVKLTEIVKNDE